MEERLLTFAIHKGRLENILDVANGLACECICPKCSEPLVAKNNPTNRKMAHFAHSSGTNCAGAYETAIHIMAKEILIETKRIKTPDFHSDYNTNNKKSKFKDGEIIEFENVMLEKSPMCSSLIIADAIGIIKGRQLIIEFAKSHFIDEEKRSKLIQLGTPCIEIDLTNQTLDKEALKEFFLSTAEDIYWICNSELDEEYREYEKKKKIEATKAKQERQDKAIIASEKKYATQQELEERHRRKYETYRMNSEYKFFTFIDGVAKHCPIIKKQYDELRSGAFYNHPILKRILLGEDWNGKIYGNYFTGRHIYLKREKIFIYPTNATEEQKRMSNLFYAGLNAIMQILEKGGMCNNCSYRIDWLAFDNKDLTVCNYRCN